MNLRQALEVLGVERVKKGMRAIDNRRVELTASETCFVGEAFGGITFSYNNGRNNVNLNLAQAARLCEIFYEGYHHYNLYSPEITLRYLGVMPDYIPQFNPDIRANDAEALENFELENYESYKMRTRNILRQECILFLAEHGETYEPGVNNESQRIDSKVAGVQS